MRRGCESSLLTLDPQADVTSLAGTASPEALSPRRTNCVFVRGLVLSGATARVRSYRRVLPNDEC